MIDYFYSLREWKKESNWHEAIGLMGVVVALGLEVINLFTKSLGLIIGIILVVSIAELLNNYKINKMFKWLRNTIKNDDDKQYLLEITDKMIFEKCFGEKRGAKISAFDYICVSDDKIFLYGKEERFDIRKYLLSELEMHNVLQEIEKLKIPYFCEKENIKAEKHIDTSLNLPIDLSSGD